MKISFQLRQEHQCLSWPSKQIRQLFFSNAAYICSLHFSSFLFISLHFSAFLYIYLHFSAFFNISLHFSPFIYICLHFSAILNKPYSIDIFQNSLININIFEKEKCLLFCVVLLYCVAILHQSQMALLILSTTQNVLKLG